VRTDIQLSPHSPDAFANPLLMHSCEAGLTNPTGETENDVLRLGFDRRIMVQFRGSFVTSNAGLLAYRELDDVLRLTSMAGNVLADPRTGKNGRQAVAGMLRQSIFGRLAGYEDVNAAERLRHDPAMRWIVGGKASKGRAASSSQMGRFETNWLARTENLETLADLSGHWIDQVAKHRQGGRVVLDLDSSVSPTHGDQESSVWNGHFGCTCYHPLFVFNQDGDLERITLVAYCPGYGWSSVYNIAKVFTEHFTRHPPAGRRKASWVPAAPLEGAAGTEWRIVETNRGRGFASDYLVGCISSARLRLSAGCAARADISAR